MKKLILISALLSVFSVSAVASDLPACEGTRPYNNCYRTFDDGTKYVGEWKDDEYHGQGTFTWPDVVKYVGQYKNGKRHGQGIMIWAKGSTWVKDSTYVGEWKDDEQHGQGTLTLKNGDKYVGEFKKNRRSGRGVMTYNDGRVEAGIWANDELVQSYENTDIYINCIIDNLKDNDDPLFKSSVILKCTRISENPSTWQKWKYSD